MTFDWPLAHRDAIATREPLRTTMEQCRELYSSEAPARRTWKKLRLQRVKHPHWFCWRRGAEGRSVTVRDLNFPASYVRRVNRNGAWRRFPGRWKTDTYLCGVSGSAFRASIANVALRRTDAPLVFCLWRYAGVLIPSQVPDDAAAQPFRLIFLFTATTSSQTALRGDRQLRAYTALMRSFVKYSPTMNVGGRTPPVLPTGRRRRNDRIRLPLPASGGEAFHMSRAGTSAIAVSTANYGFPEGRCTVRHRFPTLLDEDSNPKMAPPPRLKEAAKPPVRATAAPTGESYLRRPQRSRT